VARSTNDFHAGERGAAALFAILVFAALVTGLAVSVGVGGIGTLEEGFSTNKGSSAILGAESCAEEAILRLSRDASYTGGLLSLGTSSCSITVTGTPCGTCTITTEATAEGYTRGVEVDVVVSGSSADIIQWQEY